MSDFMPEPKVHLTTAEELVDYLNNHPNNYPEGEFSQFYPPSNDDVNVTKSDFLCDCIRELENAGKFPYHSSVWTLAREKLGLEPIDYNFWWDHQKEYPFSYKILYILVCRASQYKHSDDLAASGFAPLSQEMANEAFQKKAKIETPNGKIYNVKKINDKVYVMPKYSRNQALCLGFQPAKIALNYK
jgi:hypothetical protein